MSTQALLVILAIIEGFLITMILFMLVMYKTKKIFLASQLFIMMCIVGIFGFTITKSEVVGYKGGVIIPLDEIQSVYQMADDNYAISFGNGKREITNNIIYGDKTQFVMDCKIIKKTVFNMNLYDKANILVVDDGRETDKEAITIENKQDDAEINNIPRSEQMHNKKNKTNG